MPVPACPHAHALRAAANVERGAAGPGRSERPRRARTPRARRRTRRVAGPGTPTQSPGAATTSGVRVRRRQSTVPGLTVGLSRAGQRVGQGTVRLPPVARPSRPGRPPSGRAGDAATRRSVVGVTSSPESRAACRPARPGPGGCGLARTTSSSAACRPQPRAAAACWTGARQAAAPVEEGLLDSGGEVELGGQRRGTRELVRGQLGGKLQQRQRVAARLRDEPRDDTSAARRDPAVSREGRGWRPASRPVSDELRQPCGVERLPGTVPGGEHQGHPVRTEPAGTEEQGAGGGGVQPVRVVDDAQHQALLRRGRQQRQAWPRRPGTAPPRARRPHRTPPAGPEPEAAGSSPAVV